MAKKKVSQEAMMASINACIKDLEILEGSDDDNDYSEVENALVNAKDELQAVIDDNEEEDDDE